jgi:hypothetical protein
MLSICLALGALLLLGASPVAAAGLEPGQCKKNSDCEAPEVCFKPTKTCSLPCKIECMEDKPVCGKDGVTYACGKYEALCHGVKPKHKGVCKDECICPDVYDPVCGNDGVTYGNKCEAICAGVSGGTNGSCESPSCGGNDDCPDGEICFPPTQECQQPCDIVCIEEDLVCGKDGVTYSCGEADAFCHGTKVDHPGACEGEPCVCPEIWAPVCGVDGNTYGNACEAECAGVEVEKEGECVDPCVCPDVWDPVCGKDWETYGNGCEAECAGVEIAYEGACEVICPEICEDDDVIQVPICHRPPGNPSNAHTLAVGASAIPAHLAHGDSVGECGSDWELPTWEDEEDDD